MLDIAKHLALALIVVPIIISYAMLIRESDRLLVTSHEMVHAVVYNYFDCTNITVNVTCSWLSCSGYTTAICNTTGINKEMELLHSLNEIFGYHFTALKNIILLSAFQQLMVSIAILVVLHSISLMLKHKN